VDWLCTFCRRPKIFAVLPKKVITSPNRGAASHGASLALGRWLTRIIRPVNVIRVIENIHGRSYTIELRAVGHNRWRADLTNRRGGSTALMPFYGATAEEAAERLAHWLGRAVRPSGAA
jgi:hypothetical protein